MTNAAATPLADRIATLDVIRGFALLGILIMNIQTFAMPSSAYINPTAFGDLSGLNSWVWMLSHVLADQKFMSLFSMLFGAGICLFADRAEAKGQRPAALHYRRMLWLLVFGLIHAYLIWYGDILVAYALCGLWAYAFRRCRVKTLLIFGLVLVAISSALDLITGLSLDHMPAQAVAEIRNAWQPSVAEIDAELTAYRGGWSEQLPLRAKTAAFFQTTLFLTTIAWRVTGMMLIGMALFRSGVLGAQRSERFYWTLALIGGLVGLAPILSGLAINQRAQFEFEYSMFIGSQYNYWGSIGLAISYLCLIVLAVRGRWLTGLQSRLAAVGRTAFSNYIFQSLLCSLIFYGHGFGQFGHINRSQQLLVVVSIWVLQLLLAPYWLARFRFGPLEWVWRSLTYWRRQPLKRGS